MGGPVNHIASMEELENVVLLGMDIYIVYHDSFLLQLRRPKIAHRSKGKELQSPDGLVLLDSIVFDKDDVGAFLFIDYEPARKWSYEVFLKRAAGDRRWTI